ncbi:MAG: Holliday junction branch migration protein RuvA [Candidatus Omnitrophota bacterium]
MISRISGKLIKRNELSLVLDVNGIGYEVFIPQGVIKCMSFDRTDAQILEFITFHYYQNDQSKSIPILIGFDNEVEREFFEKFITVSGIGPKAAVKALSEPISDIARAIDNGDISFLKSLPGIGTQRAREIIAKLQGKVGKFGLIQSVAWPSLMPEVKTDLEKEALAVLLQLQYKKTEAELMIKKAIERNPNLESSEELLNEVYRQRSKQD